MFFAGYAGVFHGKAAIMNNERIRNNDDEKNLIPSIKTLDIFARSF